MRDGLKITRGTAFGVALGIGLCVWGGIATAAAQKGSKLSNVPIAGPVIAGNEALVAQGRSDYGFDLMAGANGAWRLVQSFPEGRRFSAFPHLAASSQVWAVEDQRHYQPMYKGDEGQDQVEVFAGRASGPLSPVTGPCSVYTAGWLRSVAVQAQQVAYQGPGCASGYGAFPMSVQDLGGGATMSLPGTGFGVRLAGHYAAWVSLRGDQFVLNVYDTQSHQSVYSVAPAAGAAGAGAGPAIGPVGSFDLRDDGAVAASFYAPTSKLSMRVGWASIEQPSLHVLPLPPLPHYAIRFAQDTLLVMSSAEPNFGLVADGSLKLVDLSGRVVHVVATGVDDQIGNDMFDVNSATAAFLTRTCRSAVVHEVSLDAPSERFTPPNRCSLPPMKRLHVIRGRIPVSFSCAGMTVGCQAISGRITVVGQRRPLTVARSGLDATNPLSMKPTRAGRQLLSSRRAARVRLTLRLTDTVSNGESFTETRTAITRLSA